MTQPIRVLYVLNAMGGGASLGIYESIPALREQGIIPYAISPPGSDQQRQRITSLFDGIRITPLRWWNLEHDIDPLRKAARQFGRWRRGISDTNDVEVIASCIANWEIDIVHSGTSLTVAGALAAQEKQVPHIWHIKETVGSPNRVQFPMSDAELVNYMSRMSSQIVAMSDYIAGIFRDHGCKNITVLPDGVNLTPYQTGTSRSLREKLNLTEDQLLVGMVASLTSTWKRHDVFIRMAGILAAAYPDAHFLIIGTKPSPKARFPYDVNRRYYENLEHLAQQTVPAGRLTLMDHFPDPSDIMRSLDVLVHTCDIEPFGRIAIEAMASGTPVVGPRTGGISETVIDSETGLLAEPGSPQSFADATAKLLDTPDLRQKLGDAGRLRARQKYPVNLYAQGLSRLYTSVL